MLYPRGGEEIFSQDDAHRAVGILHNGSHALEWGLTPDKHPEAEQSGGSV